MNRVADRIGRRGATRQVQVAVAVGIRIFHLAGKEEVLGVGAEEMAAIGSGLGADRPAINGGTLGAARSMAAAASEAGLQHSVFLKDGADAQGNHRFLTGTGPFDPEGRCQELGIVQRRRAVLDHQQAGGRYIRHEACAEVLCHERIDEQGVGRHRLETAVGVAGSQLEHGQRIGIELVGPDLERIAGISERREIRPDAIQQVDHVLSAVIEGRIAGPDLPRGQEIGRSGELIPGHHHALRICLGIAVCGAIEKGNGRDIR